ncbi:hypothetical protein ABZ502_27650 [Streptomyces abikoensis]|uniref:hypothetical protein n=1 Tax=Streptomyces abikoensis TaxID=97398 RepID=UPI003409BA1F
MGTRLRETASEVAALLWREHVVYRERGGGVVIRGEHVQRWISMAPSGGRGEVLVRAGRILDGGTTAPARTEALARLDAGTHELAATCRRLLAEVTTEATPSAPPTRRVRKRGRRIRKGRHTSLTSWVVIVGVIALVGLYAYNAALSHR